MRQKFPDVRAEDGYIRIYDVDDAESIAGLLVQNGFPVSEIRKNKIGLEEYYIVLMSKKETNYKKSSPKMKKTQKATPPLTNSSQMQ